MNKLIILHHAHDCLHSWYMIQSIHDTWFNLFMIHDSIHSWYIIQSIHDTWFVKFMFKERKKRKICPLIVSCEENFWKSWPHPLPLSTVERGACRTLAWRTHILICRVSASLCASPRLGERGSGVRDKEKGDPQKMKAAFCICLSRQENPWLNVFVTF